MKKKGNLISKTWTVFTFIIVCCFIMAFLAALACDNDDDDDDSKDDNEPADDDDDSDDDDGFCGSPEMEECDMACDQERDACVIDNCGTSPIDVDDPCGLYNNSDDDDDGAADDDDWSDDPELEEYCECVVECRDEAKECYAECDVLFPC